MKTETSCFRNEHTCKQGCKHPLLQATRNKNGFHTGVYVCIKCNEVIQDHSGIMMVKELSF
ncbi:MAG TPA: hypothetical protein VNX01_14930 [Bacteroidia bacterium]|nr:hypothetical protein [Bacteroidia bacterium]